MAEGPAKRAFAAIGYSRPFRIDQITLPAKFLSVGMNAKARPIRDAIWTDAAKERAKSRQ